MTNSQFWAIGTDSLWLFSPWIVSSTPTQTCKSELERYKLHNVQVGYTHTKKKEKKRNLELVKACLHGVFTGWSFLSYFTHSPLSYSVTPTHFSFSLPFFFSAMNDLFTVSFLLSFLFLLIKPYCTIGLLFTLFDHLAQFYSW